ncbi:ATP-binding cassette domain-containing protein [Candidatus Roizmanbacteria bacterium]|nr:ATP-binding cassette domain-containing protein [Candidatus Roizmanbacteria bacterium]
MIAFENVTKRFPLGNVALESVSFTVNDNDFVFLVGPSGAGKTTILRLIMHEYLPSSGNVTINDQVISSKSFRKIHELRRQIGVIFQDFKILPEKNVYENISLSLKVNKTPSSQIQQEVLKALSLVGLSKKERVFPSQLSAGELQRVAIARAIVGNRDIILADEPTGNLDPKTAWEIMKIFKKLEGRKTIIIATHNTDIVNSLQKRVILMKDGRLIKDMKKGGYEL